MKKKIIALLSVTCGALLCTGLTACNSNQTKIEELQDSGYKITVTYDPNGGAFMNLSTVTIVDMYKPTDYEKDGEGKVHIPLTEPTDAARPTIGGDRITCTKSGHFFAGWYQSREIKKVDGKPVDSNGNVLSLQKDGTYVIASTENDKEPKKSTPAYLYDGYWDFDEDTLVYEGNGVLNVTLYAGWVEFYEFEYYKKNAQGDWETYGTTTFNYKDTSAENSKTADKDTIWIPEWKDGAMSYTCSYANGDTYKFPKIAGTTFYKAYSDAACTQEITHSFEHQGSLDIEHALAINPVQKIYVDVEQGEKYRITKPEQLVKAENVNLAGEYEIFNDLDFQGLAWPIAFASGTFTGKLFGSEGKTYTLSNINAEYVSTSPEVGGIFGRLDKGAEIKQIHFEKVSLDLKSAVSNQRNDKYFALLIGNIEDGAIVQDVQVRGGILRIGSVGLHSGKNSFHLIANGNSENIIATDIKLQVYGNKLMDNKYQYLVDPESVSIDENNNIKLTFKTGLTLEKDVYDIETNGGKSE